MGRFINADAYTSTGQGLLGNNMFAYCGNNPIVRKDSAGTVYVFLDDSIIDVDPDGSLDEGGSGGGGGFGLGVNPSYYTAQRVQTYDWNWQNSSYNQNPIGSVGSSVQATSNTPINNSSSSPRRTADQQALADLANEVNRNAKKGSFISYEEAKLLDEWAKEYNVQQGHTAEIGSGTHWVTGWDHTHIYNIHVPFK